MKEDDKAYRLWIQTLPSAISGRYSEYVDGQGRNPCCHVRRAKTFGVRFKAPFSAIPLTHQEHRLQHMRGEAACLDAFLPSDAPWTTERSKLWFDSQVAKYRAKWEAHCKI